MLDKVKAQLLTTWGLSAPPILEEPGRTFAPFDAQKDVDRRASNPDAEPFARVSGAADPAAKPRELTEDA
jgi:hypothetical protein